MFVYSCFGPFQSMKGNVSKSHKMPTSRINASKPLMIPVK